MFNDVIQFIKSLYPNKEMVSLHEPIFIGNERKYVLDTIDSTFVSSVGAYVGKFEQEFSNYTKAKCSVTTVNGTSALHMALWALGVQPDDEVLTQALTFVATANAIKYCYANPVFIDSDPLNLGMSLDALRDFLETYGVVEEDICRNKKTGKIIKACVPMHVFGHPVQIDKIVELCESYKIPVVEDAAESLGSLYKDKHTGLFGKIGVFSLNGNKTITSGGGGMIVTNDLTLGKRIKHLTTTAKIPHQWEFYHDEVGFNYRMPNINAALACAQLEKIEEFVLNKRNTAQVYAEYFSKRGIRFHKEPEYARSNYWLNAIFLENKKERDLFIEKSCSSGVLCRPVWTLIPDLPMYENCHKTELTNAKKISDCLVNIPSGIREYEGDK